MLMQRPINFAGLGSVKDILSSNDQDYMKNMAANRFDQIIVTLQALPREILLVIR